MRAAASAPDTCSANKNSSNATTTPEAEDSRTGSPITGNAPQAPESPVEKAERLLVNESRTNGSSQEKAGLETPVASSGENEASTPSPEAPVVDADGISTEYPHRHKHGFEASPTANVPESVRGYPIGPVPQFGSEAYYCLLVRPYLLWHPDSFTPLEEREFDYIRLIAKDHCLLEMMEEQNNVLATDTITAEQIDRFIKVYKNYSIRVI
ncbi:hypothetical protein MBLNU230_g6524t1 [Neophaeotheca triangularis]